MEKQESKEYRDNLVTKLKGARELDKDIAQQYKEKAEQSAEYKDAREEKIKSVNEGKISEEEKQKEAKINALKAEIAQMDIKNEIDKSKDNLDNMGELEGVIFIKIKRLIESSEKDEDKKAFLEVFNEFEKRKEALSNFRKEYVKADFVTRYPRLGPPTRENMVKNKFYKKWFINDDNKLHEHMGWQKFLEEGEKWEGSMGWPAISLDKLTTEQKEKLFNAFLKNKNIKNHEDLLEDYNKNIKGFFGKKATLENEHKILYPTEVEGLYFASRSNKNIKEEDICELKLSMGDRFIDETFEEKI